MRDFAEFDLDLVSDLPEFLTQTAYLKNTYGQVSRFGRGKTPGKEGGLIKGEFMPISNGIVTETGNVGRKEIEDYTEFCP